MGRYNSDLNTDLSENATRDLSGRESDSRVLTVARFEADPDETAHRRKAFRKHLFRAATQLVQGAIILGYVAASPWLRALLASGVKTGFADAQSPTYIWLIVGGLIPVFLGLWYIRMRWYLFLMDLEWREQAARADAREPETCSQGYMQMFRIYARTKRRATFTFLIGLAALYSAAASFLAIADFDLAGAAKYGLQVAAGLEMIAAAFIIYVAFDISRRFVPGKNLVTKTLIMSFLATTSQTDYTDAREQSKELQRSMREKKPWWFYTYARRPKGDD